MDHIRSIIGIFFLLGVAWLLSNNKRKIDFRVVVWGLGLQFLFALIILKTGPGQAIFFFLQEAFLRLLSFSDEGARFIFGDLMLGISSGAGHSYQVIDAGTGGVKDLTEVMADLGPRFAFRVLPAIIFFASLIAIFYHLGVMQRIVEAVGWVMARTMGTSGGESLSVACNIFVGQCEAPIMVKPYISGMTRSELMAVMVGGFATISGVVMAAYVSFGVDAGHLMSATVMSAPAALVVAKIIFPEVGEPLTSRKVRLQVEKDTVNVVDAAAKGATTGLRLALNVAAMLIAFIALIALINFPLNYLGTSLKQVLGIIFAPAAFFMGVPMNEVFQVGQLLGTKVSINEFVAYIDLTALKGELSIRSFTICTYALCGFANFSSIAMQIGGIGSLAPDRKTDLAKLGLKAMIGGALASWITAAIAGILIA